MSTPPRGSALRPRALLLFPRRSGDLRDDLGGFQRGPSLQRRRPRVALAPDRERDLHRGLVVRQFRHEDEVVAAHRDQRGNYLSAVLLDERLRRLRPLRPVLHLPDSLLPPLAPRHLVRHGFPPWDPRIRWP